MNDKLVINVSGSNVVLWVVLFNPDTAINCTHIASAIQSKCSFVQWITVENPKDSFPLTLFSTNTSGLVCTLTLVVYSVARLKILEVHSKERKESEMKKLIFASEKVSAVARWVDEALGVPPDERSQRINIQIYIHKVKWKCLVWETSLWSFTFIFFVNYNFLYKIIWRKIFIFKKIQFYHFFYVVQ